MVSMFYVCLQETPQGNTTKYKAQMLRCLVLVHRGIAQASSILEKDL